MKTLLLIACLIAVPFLVCFANEHQGWLPSSAEGGEKYGVVLIGHPGGGVDATVYDWRQGLLFTQHLAGTLPRGKEEVGKLAANIVYVHSRKGGEIAPGSFYFSDEPFFIGLRNLGGVTEFDLVVRRKK